MLDLFEVYEDDLKWVKCGNCFLAPAVTVETEGAMDSASVLVFTSSFAYN